ncbi:hypothetical protein AUP68_07647 [Ilyonectria robusta]
MPRVLKRNAERYVLQRRSLFSPTAQTSHFRIAPVLGNASIATSRATRHMTCDGRQPSCGNWEVSDCTCVYLTPKSTKPRLSRHDREFITSSWLQENRTSPEFDSSPTPKSESNQLFTLQHLSLRGH